MEGADTKRGSTCNSLSDLSSLKNLKLKISYENLKENLFPDNKTTKRTMENSCSKRTVKIKIKKDDYTVDKMLKKALELKHKHSHLKEMYRENRKKKHQVENEMSNSTVNMESIFGEKNQFKKKIQQYNLKRVKSESQTLTVSAYVNDLKYKHNHMEETIKTYENVIKRMKLNNQNLIKHYEQKYKHIGKKICYLDAEKFEYYDQINFLNNLIVEQENKIDDLEVEKALIVRKLDDETNHYKTILDINTQAFSKLENKFQEESSILFHYKMSTDIMMNEAELVQGKLKKSKGNIKNLEKQIKIFEQKNDVLRKQVNELSLKLSNVKSRRRYKSISKDSPTSKKSPNVSFNF